MSVVPFTTQARLGTVTQSSQWTFKVVLVYTDKITQRQSAVMKECENLLHHHVGTLVCKTSEIPSLPIDLKYFVIPAPNEDLIRMIKARFGKRLIYTPRAVIEARTCFRVVLPPRSFAVSLTMYNCHVFLVKACAKDDVRQKINEMCGTVVSSFGDNQLNVVVTDRSDNKYCQKAFKRGKPVVSRDWIRDNYNIATEEEDSFYKHDAMTNIQDYKIGLFHGLHFKIITKESIPEIKRIILDNQGRIVYGEDPRLTHIVTSSVHPEHFGNIRPKQEYPEPDRTKQRPKTVDIDFLKLCVRSGHYTDIKEFSESQTRRSVNIKQERRSPPLGNIEDNFTATTLSPVRSANSIENRSNMLMPPPTPRTIGHNQQQTEKVTALMNEAISTLETSATQRVSTQMRRLPEPELRIEQSLEPSQHLFWNDSTSKRNF